MPPVELPRHSGANDSGMTPITVHGSRSTEMLRPTTSTAPPNCDCQILCDRIVTCAPLENSSGAKIRPSAGAVLNTANVCAGDSVVIFGAGGVGLNAISGARIAGASRIVVIDIQPKRLEAATKFGATDVIDSTTTKPVEAVRDLFRGGADHVFDFVGLKSVAEQGLAMLNVGGGLYLVGVSKPEVNLDLNIFDAIGGQKRVQGVNFGSTNFKRDIPMYAELYLQGRMNLDDLVSKKIALRDVNDGYAALKDGSLNRVVVTSF